MHSVSRPRIAKAEAEDWPSLDGFPLEHSNGHRWATLEGLCHLFESGGEFDEDVLAVGELQGGEDE